MKYIVFITVLASVAAASAEKLPLSRYQSIIDRQMFGAVPPGFDPTVSPNEVQRTTAAEEKQLTEEQKQLQSAVHFSVINVGPDGVPIVGFTDSSDPKAPKHYYLRAGESSPDGWTVRAADAEKATATIVKGEIELDMKLGDNSAGKSGAAPAAAKEKGVAFGNHSGGSLRSRRMLRNQQEAARQAEERARQAEEQAKRDAERDARAAEEKAQRDQEREEQRRQLQAIQEELKKAREARMPAKTDAEEQTE